MKKIEIYKITTNRSIYNRTRKSYLANYEGMCEYCGYHRGENSRNHYHTSMNTVSWKLLGKRKQWMGKTIPKKLKPLSPWRGGII